MLTSVLWSLSSCTTPTEVILPQTAFDGTFTVQESNPKDNYLLTLRKNPEKANTFTIENLANLVKNPLEGKATGKRLVIKQQAFTNYLGDQYTISGEGEMVDETLILHYTIKGYNGYAGAVFAKKQVDGK
ncbi:hypothetical protein GCM10028803_24630 [Larkinella knui]|uniref:Uncharacterized protein n=1 Tax=Larkinella knui TaxID=2025310 RepID=A0A3P1CW52_9BACT|nr:hypothetical protein [Larkinella knui]RRB17523.1 hypothetical protein EHT87_04350 [Larkinella knui]